MTGLFAGADELRVRHDCHRPRDRRYICSFIRSVNTLLFFRVSAVSGPDLAFKSLRQLSANPGLCLQLGSSFSSRHGVQLRFLEGSC